MQIDQGSQSGANKWYYSIRAGQAFARSLNQTASIGNFSHVQLFNPAGSGVNIVLRRILIDVDVPSDVAFRQHDTAFAVAPVAGKNLLAGATSAAGVVDTTATAGESGTTYGQFPVPADSLYPFIDDWFGEIGPGEGFLVGARTVNVALRGWYQWIELPI